jgi:hypothetical protein
MEYLCHKWPQTFSTCLKHFPVLSSFITYHRFAIILTRRVPLVEQELLTLPELLSSPPYFSGVCVTRSLVLCVCFVDRCLRFFILSVGHCVVCSSSICGFWLFLWYIQTLLMNVLRHVDMVFSAYLGFINQCNKPLDKTEILLKLVLSTITIAPNPRLLHIIAKDMYYIDTSKYVQGLAEKVKHPLRGNIIVF